MWKWIITYIFVCAMASAIQRSNANDTIKLIADLVIIVGLWLVIKKWRQHKKAKNATLTHQSEISESNISPPKNPPNNRS